MSALTDIAGSVPCRIWRPLLRLARMHDGLHALFCPTCDLDVEEEDGLWPIAT